MSRSVNFKCKGPEVQISLANGKAAWKPVAAWDWGGEQRGDVVSKGAGGQVILDLEGHGEHSESLSDSSSVMLPWIPALARSSPGGGRWMGKKSGNNAQVAREPSLKAGEGGECGERGLATASTWTLAPLPAPLLDPAQELEAVARDQRGKLTMLGC